MFDFETIATPAVAPEAAIPPGGVIDITSMMTSDGRLNWDVPAGNWTILRMGYSLTGAKNGPAVPAGTGYEVDKFNKDHLKSYYSGFTTRIRQTLGPLYGKTLQFYLVDSYEANAQNWTEEMIAQFVKWRGYDPVPYLPALAGRIVESAEVSDRFLWDFRRTIADLLAEEHYGTIAKLAHAEGIKLYGEAAGISLPIIQDALLNKSKVDIPMGEFGMARGASNVNAPWLTPSDLETDHSYNGANDRILASFADIREAASASHIYGKKYVAAESWTGGGFEAPASLKSSADYWNTQGVNRFVFHTSTHQPLDTKPGNAMVGTHFHRNITWAEQSAPFFTYLARNSYMLQQGQSVADIVYYLGESIPSSVPYWEMLNPVPPAGYDYDFMNTEILLENTTVENGLIVLKSGMKYRVLVLPDTKEMTPHVLAKIKELVSGGATVVGPKPEKSPSLLNYPGVDNEVAFLANEIWGGVDGKLIFHHPYGKGMVYCGAPLAGILVDLKTPKDLDYTRPHTNTNLSWIHRKTNDGDIYFIVNMRNQSEKLDVMLRVNGKTPELWHSDTGLKEAVSYSIKNGLTTVPLILDPQESVFIVLREQAQNQELQLPETVINKLADVSGPWNVAFQPNLGAPASIMMDGLVSWTENKDEGVKYFSGTATYSKEIQAPKTWFKSGERQTIDLGEVWDIAEVILNGKSVGTLWKAPYIIDVTGLLKQGANKLEVKVTNEWTNRIAGDRNLPAEKKILSGEGSSRPMAQGQSTPLPKSGLIGPVKILTEK
jgi:hypothetical protein